VPTTYAGSIAAGAGAWGGNPGSGGLGGQGGYGGAGGNGVGEPGADGWDAADGLPGNGGQDGASGDAQGPNVYLANGLNISPLGHATQLVVTTEPPRTVAAGIPFCLLVAAEDADGNVDPSFHAPVTIALAANPGNSTLGGTLTVNAFGGVATFSNLTLNEAGNGYRLKATSAGVTLAISNSFNVAGQATQLAVTTEPPGSVIAGDPFSLVVQAEDANGNVDPTFGAPVTISLAANPGNSTLGGTVTANASGGVATFSNLTLNEAGNGYKLTATSSGLTSATSARFDVTDQLVVTAQPPDSVTAGAPFGLVVTAEDGLGNVDTSYSGSVTVMDYYQLLGGTTTVRAVDGVATFSGLTLDQANYSEYMYLDVSANGLPHAYTNYFTVNPATATQLGIPSRGNVVAGSTFSITVDATDPYGNVDTTFSGNVTLALANNPGGATLVGTLTQAAVSGEATFSGLTLDMLGSGYTLTATGSGLTSATSALFDVTDRLVVTTQPPNSVTAGAPFGLVVAAEDGLGNVDTSYSGSVTVTDYDQMLGGTTTVTAVDGVATFSGLTLDQANYYEYLDVSANGLPDTYTNCFTVNPAAATQLGIPSFGNIVVGSTFSITVDAIDPYGNVDPTFNGNVTVALAANPGKATLGGTLTVNASYGEATFTDLTLDMLGSGYTLTATSSGLTSATSAPFDVTDQLVVTAQPPSSVTAGAPFGLVVAAEDGLGNVDASYSGSVTVTDYDQTLAGTTTLTAVDGVATFSGLTLDQANYYEYLDVSANGLPDTYTNWFTVNPATATQLDIPSFGDVVAGSTFSITVYAMDPYGNVDPTFNGNVTLALANNPSGATLGGTLTQATAWGEATFSDLTLDMLGSGYTLTATSSPPLTSAMSAPFAATDQLVVTTQPPDNVTAGAPFGLVVTAEDGLGNVDASYSGSVTVTCYDQTLGGTTTVTAVDGVATFSGLTLNRANSYEFLDASGNGLQDVYTIFTVNPATATQLGIHSFGSVAAGSPFSMTVEATDPYGNVDPTFSGNVTVALANNPSGATLGGTLTQAAVRGEATFSDLTLDMLGSGYTLQASADNLTPATTDPFDVTQEVLTVDSFQTLDSLEASSKVGVVIGSGGYLTVNNPITLDSGGAVSVLDGGWITVPGINSQPGATGIDLDGGTLQASGPFTTAAPIMLGTGGGTVDSNGNNLALGGALTGPGGLTLTGGGTVTVSAANHYTGGTFVSDVVLVAENSAAIPSGSLLSIGADGSVVLGHPGASEPLAVIQAPGVGPLQAAAAATGQTGTETASLVVRGTSVTPAGGGAGSPAVGDAVLAAAAAAPTAVVAPAAVDYLLAIQGVPGVVCGPSTPFVPQGVPPNCHTYPFAGPGWPSRVLAASPVQAGDAAPRVAALQTAASSEASDELLLRIAAARAGNAAARAGNQQPATGFFGLDLQTLDLLAGEATKWQ
jgi:autotransporter-associated beta strand protein